MIKPLFRIPSLLLFLLFFSGCDPTYPIFVTNGTTEVVEILIKESVNFRTEKQKTRTTSDGFDVYELAPNEKIKVGYAIAEINNDIPFESIKIVRNSDTISANELEEIKKLFDKKIFGILEKPYNLTIN